MSKGKENTQTHRKNTVIESGIVLKFMCIVLKIDYISNLTSSGRSWEYYMDMFVKYVMLFKILFWDFAALAPQKA